jgi:hypothetical protein
MPRRNDDALDPHTCWRCGLRGPYESAKQCITSLRDQIAELEKHHTPNACS